MKRKGYSNEVYQGFPEIVLPLTEEQMRQIETMAQGSSQTKYVAKSDKLSVLTQELLKAEHAYKKVNNLAIQWGAYTKDVANWTVPELPYMEYTLDGTEGAISSSVKIQATRVKEYTSRIVEALEKARCVMQEHKDRLSTEYEIEKKGDDGEDLVGSYISRNLNCQVLTSVVLPGIQDQPYAPKTAETDLMVISDHGVYVCEIKNYGRAGQYLKVQPTGEIAKCAPDGFQLEILPSPFAQNERHCKAVRNALEEAGLQSVPVYPAVVIANPDVIVVNEYGLQISNVSVFCNMVQKMRGDAYSVEQQAAIVGAINGRRLEDRRFPIESVQTLCDTIQFTMPAIIEATQSHGSFMNEANRIVNAWIDKKQSEWKRRHPMVVFYAAYRTMLFDSNFIAAFLMTAGVLAFPLWGFIRAFDYDLPEIAGNEFGRAFWLYLFNVFWMYLCCSFSWFEPASRKIGKVSALDCLLGMIGWRVLYVAAVAASVLFLAFVL